MNKHTFIFQIIFSLIFLFSGEVDGQPLTILANPTTTIDHIGLSDHTLFFEDTTCALLALTVVGQKFAAMPRESWMARPIANARSSIWLRFSLDNMAGRDTARLVFYPGVHTRTTLFQIKKGLAQYEATGGLMTSAPKFDWLANTNGLPVVALPGERAEYLVLVEDLFRLRRVDEVRAELFSPDGYRRFCAAYRERQLPILLSMGFLIGGLALMSLFGAMQFFLTRWPAYFWYSMFALANLLNNIRLLEIMADLRWITSFVSMFQGYTSLPPSLFFYLLFIRDFLDLPSRENMAGRLLGWAAWLFGGISLALVILASIHFSKNGVNHWVEPIIRFSYVLVLFPGLLLFYLMFTIKKRLIWFVAVGTILLMSASTLTMVRPLFVGDKPIHEQAPLENLTILMGGFIILETLCFALGLGYKTKILEDQKRLAVEKQGHDRLRIARDLHDEVGSTLSSISILSTSTLRNVEKDLDNARLGNIGEKARAALDSISDIVWSVNPQNDSMEKVLARMSAYASELLENVGTELHFEVGAGVEALTLPMEKRKDFYLIFKEAIHNIVKYAGAKQVEVAIKKEDNTLVLSIKDDGVGFELDDAAPDRRNLGGNGLQNMRSRAAAMGADFQIKSVMGSGTIVLIKIAV